jgi:regulator of sigma E protease
MISLIVFIFILGLLVLIHEFGHFIVAKKNGILVEEFGFGFPPRIWGIKKGETLYSINAIPLGGFVKVYGEEYHEENGKVDERLKNRAFVNKKPWQKSAVIVAGVVMNLLLASAIYYGLLIGNGFKSEALPLIGDHKFAFGTAQKQVAVINVIKDSPAQKAGISQEDVVVRYEADNTTWKNINSAEELINTVKSSDGKVLKIELENIKNGTKKTVSVIPKYDEKAKRALMGVNMVDIVIIQYKTPIQKILSGFMHSYNMADYNFKAIGFLIATSFKAGNVAPVSQAVAGPVGIYAAVNDTVTTSGGKILINLLNLTAMLSLSLAVMNILPFPALDGGRLVFIIYEWVTKKRVNEAVERYSNLLGFAILISMAILITISDVSKYLKFFIK